MPETISRVIICRKPATEVATLPGHREIKKMEKKIEDLNKTINAKLHLLKFTRSQVSSATENGNLTSMKMLRNTLAMKVEEVHDFKVKVHVAAKRRSCSLLSNQTVVSLTDRGYLNTENKNLQAMK